MTDKTITFIIAGVALAVLIAIIATIPLRKKRILEKAGKLLLPLQNGVSYKVITLFMLSLLIVAVIPLRNFALHLQIIFALVSIIAATMGAKEASGLGKAGIYENLIISGTYVIPFEDILSLPTVAYEDAPETYGVDKTTLEIIRESDAARVLLLFENEEKRTEALQAILKIRPELKIENEE